MSEFRSPIEPAAASPPSQAAGKSQARDAQPLPSLDAVRRGLSLLSGIIDLLPVGVSVQDGDGNYLLVNTFGRRLIGSDAPSLAHEHGQTSDPSVEQGAGDWERAPIVAEEISYGGAGALLRLARAGSLNNEPVVVSAYLDISERKQVERALAQRADFDELTGLPNRALIEKHIQGLIREANSRFAVAFLDVDDFKQINDYYGHAIGDALLVQLSRRISSAISRSDILARISGDEFLLVLNGSAEDGAMAAVINEIIDGAKQPFVIDAFEICISVSIGVSLYPNQGLDYKTLRHNADSAMYQIKREKKGGAALFDPKIEHLANERLQVEQRLRLAIRDRRFRCAYQPKVDIYSGEVVGVEALVRLLDENGDVQKPDSFVNLAIELGLIDDLTHLAVMQITDSIDQINDAFGSSATISVNIAAKQASNIDFMRSVAETFASTASTERFIIEVTEDAFVARNQFQGLVLPMLRENGLRVSIDDFGTGYSSLSALADITADELKIDRSFIANIHERKRNQSILRAIESLANALGMTVVAEGVESIEELNYLRTMTRIRLAQGFYYAKPIFLEDASPFQRSEGRARTATHSRKAMEERAAARRLR